MNTNALDAIIGRYPRQIPFPRIERVHRPGRKGLADVRSIEDLPSRLIFGDLVADSFIAHPDGWEVAYRDAFGNGLDLSVAGRQFTARPKFLGSDSLSSGPLNPPQAFPQLLNLAAGQWNRVLKETLESRYPVTVAEQDSRQATAMYLPDGWLRTVLIPVAAARLPELLDWHLALADDSLLGTTQSGGVSLAFNAVNYVEGRCSDECSNANLLLVRSLLSTGTPLLAPVEREEANDCSAALTVRRAAYVYLLTAFIRDIPHLVDRLHQDGFLSGEPDQCSAVVPTEPAMVAEELRWASRHGECHITWAWLEDHAASPLNDFTAVAADSNRLIGEALAAAQEFEDFMGLGSQIEAASSNEQAR